MEQQGPQPAAAGLTACEWVLKVLAGLGPPEWMSAGKGGGARGSPVGMGQPSSRPRLTSSICFQTTPTRSHVHKPRTFCNTDALQQVHLRGTWRYQNVSCFEHVRFYLPYHHIGWWWYPGRWDHKTHIRPVSCGSDSSIGLNTSVGKGSALAMRLGPNRLGIDLDAASLKSKHGCCPQPSPSSGMGAERTRRVVLLAPC